jgi:hypothetical protein
MKYDYFYQKNYWLGVVIASFVKFVFIYSLATIEKLSLQLIVTLPFLALQQKIGFGESHLLV